MKQLRSVGPHVDTAAGPFVGAMDATAVGVMIQICPIGAVGPHVDTAPCPFIRAENPAAVSLAVYIHLILHTTPGPLIGAEDSLAVDA